MNKKFNKIMSLILVFCMLLTLIPTSIFTNIKAVNANDVNNDNWEIGLKLYETTNGERQINNIVWDSTTPEQKTYKLILSYKNTISEKTYAPGEIRFEVDSILDNIRDCTSIIETGDFQGLVPDPYKAEFFIDADKDTDLNKKSQWSYSVETTGGTYHNVPTKFIITNNETLEAATSYQGTIAITFTLDSNAIKNASAGTYGAVFKTNDGTSISTNTFDFSFTSSRLPYDLYFQAEKLRSTSGLNVDANNYYWVKYNNVYYYDSTAGVRQAFNKNLKVNIPAGAIMYNSEFQQLTPESGTTYNLGTIKEYLNSSNLNENTRENKTFIVAFPKNTNPTLLQITGYLYGTYRDENTEVLLSEDTDQRLASEFDLDYDGELYWIGKTIMTTNVPHEGILTTGANAKWKLYYGAKYNAEIGPINMICGDDILYAQDEDYNWYQLSDDEYTFVGFNSTYENNQAYYGLRTMGTGIDVSNKYDVAIYLRYKNSTEYTLWKQGKLNDSGIGANLTFPADVVGVQFKILNSDNEDIELYGDLEVKFTSTKMASNSEIYNFSYLEIEKTNGTPVDLEITEENYLTTPTKEYIMQYDQNKYGHLMFRSTDYTIASSSKAFINIDKNIDSNSYNIDLNNEKIKFNYTFNVSLNTNPTEELTDSFLGFTLVDLLPEGVDLIATPEQIKAAVIANASTGFATHNLTGEDYRYSNKRHPLFEEATTVEVIEDYNNTGRTLIRIILDFSHDPIDLTYTQNRHITEYPQHATSTLIWTFLKNIPIACQISFDTWYQLGSTYVNDLYVADTNHAKGYSTFMNDANPTTQVAIPGQVEDHGILDPDFIDVDGDGNTDEIVGYARLNKSLNVAISTHTGLVKMISADGENYTKGTITLGYNKDYSYRIRATIGVDNKANNLKIFDSIEDVSTGWKGTLTGFDTSWAENKGYTVKIYYATTDFSTTEKYTTDLTNSFWSEYVDGVTDLSTIKHVAFAFYNANGTVAEFEAGDVMYVVINMKTPKTTKIDRANTEVNELQTANNARFMINSLNAAGTVVETVDLPSNTVYALLPSALLQILKIIPTDRAAYQSMGMDPDEQYSFQVKFTHKATGQAVGTGIVKVKLAGGSNLSVTPVSLTGFRVGETYIIEEVLEDNSLFVFNNVINKTPSSVSLNLVDGKYEFVISEDISSDITLQLAVNNNINFKTVDIEVNKEVIGTDRAFAYYGYSRTDSFDIKLLNKNDTSIFKRAVINGGGKVVINDIAPGTYILEETNLPTGWALKAMTALNSVDGVSMSLVNGKYEITIANTVVNNSTFQVKISNELTKPTEINLQIMKEISGTDKAFEQLDFNRTDNFEFNIKVTNKSDSTEVKQGTVSTTGNLTLNDLHAGTWIIEETDLEDFWILKEMTAVNTINGISLNKVGNNYEITIADNAPDNSTFQIKINNELQETGDPFIKVIFKKTINGTREAYDNLKLDPNGEYEFQMNLVNSNYKVHGIVSNKEDLVIMELPVGSYIVTESRDPYFDFVSMQALNSVAGVTFTQENGNYILNVTEDIMGDEVITIQVTNEILPDAYYNSKDEKINLFEIDFTSYAIYSNTDNSLTFIVSTTEPVVGETYNNKNITNVYTGFELAHYEENGTPWDAVKTQITRVDFMHEIKPISTAHWFQGMTKCIEINCEKLNTENVTDMSAMFSGCKLLEVADVSRFNTSKVTSLYDMFYNCQKLKTIDVSNWNTGNVTDMDFVFQSCYEVESLNLKNWNTSKVTTMRYMFDNCKVLTNLDLSSFNTSKVVNMERMFAYCYDLESVNLTSFTFESAGSLKMMFGYCRSLKYLNLENFDTKNVTTMTDMLYGVSGLERITVGENFKLEGNGQSSAAKFPASGGALCNGNWYRVPDEVKFTAAELPDETLATYIGSNPESIKLTSKNYHLTDMPESGEVIIPETIVDNGIVYHVTGIGDAFSNKNITKITIPKSVVEIDNNALRGKGTIEHIAVDPENPKFKDIDGVLFSKSGKTLIQYPASKAGTNYTIPSTTEVVGTAAFYQNKNITTLTIPSGVDSINPQAFREMKSLTSVTMPNILNLSNQVFINCRNLVSVVFPMTRMNYIGYGVFSECRSLKSVALPGIITEEFKNNSLFKNCTSLETVILPQNTTKIGAFMFFECYALNSVPLNSLPLEVIGSFSFLGTKASLTIPSTVHTIEEYAFFNNAGTFTFQNITNLTTIENYVFSNTNKLTTSQKNIITAKNPNAIGGSIPSMGFTGFVEQIVYDEQVFVKE